MDCGDGIGQAPPIREWMKLALIRRHASASGGAELYLGRLIESLAQAGHELHLFAQGSPERMDDAVRMHAMSISGPRASQPLFFAQAVQSALEREPFDCVFSLERTLRQDVYRAGDGVHRVWLERRAQFAPWWRKPFVGWGAFHRNMLRLESMTFDPRHTGRIIVNSEMVRHEILRHFHFPENRIHLVRNGIDTGRFQRGNRQATRERFHVGSEDYLLLFAGSGWERKGLPYLIEVMARFEEADAQKEAHPNGATILLVAGKGRPPRNCPRNIRFAGSMPDIENACAAADLFVFPPIYEPSANACFEAMAAGLPVVTSACNGASECIRETINGTVVPNPADISGLADAVRYWIRQARRIRDNPLDALDMRRNVAETMAVIEWAASEKKAFR
jgi:UDP-glucose:(heptosyl)LPS alpha-1,3-glucosyltransferase